MTYVHRESDARVCGAVTLPQGQDFVKVDGKLWAVQGDPNSDGGGGLIASKDYIFINSLPIIVQGDHAVPDTQCFFIGPPHCDPYAVGFDDLINVG